MPRNNNYITTETWIRNNSVVYRRKFYTLEELYGLFIDDSGLRSITLRGFSRNINKCVEKISNFDRIEVGYRKFRFIMKQTGSDSISAKTRISSRGRGHIPSDTQSSPTSSPTNKLHKSPPQLQRQTPTTTIATAVRLQKHQI